MTDTCLPENKDALRAMIVALQAQRDTLRQESDTLQTKNEEYRK